MVADPSPAQLLAGARELATAIESRLRDLDARAINLSRDEALFAQALIETVVERLAREIPPQSRSSGA